MTPRQALLAGALLWTAGLPGQALFDAAPGMPLLFHPSDAAVLSATDNRKDLDCRIEALRPRLGFDLRYTAGYAVKVPASSVSPAGERLRVLFRVRPAEPDGAEPVYFQQSLDVPAQTLDSEGSGSAWFQGRYFLGPGRYRVDWLMRNAQGHVCSAHWRTEAPRPRFGDRPAAAAEPYLIAPFRQDTFDEEPPVVRSAGAEAGLHVRLLLNLAPLDRSRMQLNAYEMGSLIGMLRSLHREPDLSLFSLTAFHAYDRRIVYSTDRTASIDFPDLGRAVGDSPSGVVDVAELADTDGDQEFMTHLLTEFLAEGPDPPDALVVLGPKVDRDAIIERRLSASAAQTGGLFRFAFNRSPRSYPWPGALEAALAPYGAAVFSITSPQDFMRAVAALLDSVQGRTESPTPTED